MKEYVMAFLKAGPVKLKDTVEASSLLKAHLRNIQHLAAEGKLIVAAPFLDEQEFRGIFIFNAKSLEEARKLCESDPAIKAGTLIMELHPSYGSAGLMDCVRIHKKIEKKNVAG